LAAREKRTEPTQENITLCYESLASTPALQCFHVVRRAPGVLPLAGRYRARAVLRANDRAPTGTRAGFHHGGKLQRIGASWEYSACARWPNGNGCKEENDVRNSNASARSVSTPNLRKLEISGAKIEKSKRFQFTHNALHLNREFVAAFKA
jgi:hypothetical protein